jgi:hypothetical protein
LAGGGRKTAKLPVLVVSMYRRRFAKPYVPESSVEWVIGTSVRRGCREQVKERDPTTCALGHPQGRRW